MPEDDYELAIPPVTQYRVEIERDGAWWDITGLVTRYTATLHEVSTLYVREPLPVPLPTRLRVFWQQTVPTAAWDNPLWAQLAAAHGIQPDVPFDGEMISAVQTVTVEPPPLFDLTAPARLTVTVIEGDPDARP